MNIQQLEVWCSLELWPRGPAAARAAATTCLTEQNTSACAAIFKQRLTTAHAHMYAP